MVEVGVPPVVPVPEPELVEGVLDDVLEDDDPPVVGEGETIDGVVVLEDVVVVVPDEPADDALAEGAGLLLSFGTPLAKGSRAIRASTTLAGSVDDVVDVVDVSAPAAVAVAAGGAGTVGVALADACLSKKTGTAATATTRIATTIQSLRSTRSRRSELIPVLRWWSWRPGWPAGRSWPRGCPSASTSLPDSRC